ncbi:MAG: hypothetical protein ACRDTH_08815 [Pseudonocardiaceae bacterium]
MSAPLDSGSVHLAVGQGYRYAEVAAELPPPWECPRARRDRS